MDVRLPDGTIIRNVPDNMTKSELQEKLAANGYDISKLSQQQIQTPAQPEQQTTTEQQIPPSTQEFQASIPGRILQGARDPIDAAAQLLPRGLKGLTSLGGLFPNKVSDFFGSEAKRVDEMNTQNEREYQAARKATGQRGFDGARFAGNVISPVNAAGVIRIPSTAATTAGKVLYGAQAGAIGGALTPVNSLEEGQSFWGTKAAQTGFGAAGGAIAGPVLSKLGEAVARRVNARDAEVIGARASVETDKILSDALDEIGQKLQDLPEQQIKSLRQQVVSALKDGKKIDAAAILRKQDFELEGIPATLGQVTRDATQYARERNLRGVAGVGEPLLNRFELQNQMLQKKVSGLGGAQSSASFAAGEKIADTLKSVDENLRSEVGGLYKAARESSGKDWAVPLQGLAQDYAEVLRNFGDKVPSGVRNRMRELGLLSGRQTKVFSVQDAENLLQTINDNVSNDIASNRALDQLRNAVKNAVLQADDSGGVFAPAREAAAKRFALQDAVPALKSAATGQTAPDDFVKKFVVNGKAREVKGLAELLRSSDTGAFQEAKSQIGATLQRAAFGENAAGDKAFSPESYAKALRELGEEKLSAFYSQAEIDQLKRIGRIGAYINSTPNASPVNYSNSASAVVNLLGAIPGVSPAVSTGAALLKSARNAVNNQRVVSQGLAANPVAGQAELTPEQIAMMVKILGLGGVAAGGASAAPLRE